jgi:hypothetical protein
LAAEDGVRGVPGLRGNSGSVATVERSVAGEAKERAESGDAPISDGLLEVGTTVELDRYHNLVELSVGVMENRDETDPTPAVFPTTVASREEGGRVDDEGVVEAAGVQQPGGDGNPGSWWRPWLRPGGASELGQRPARGSSMTVVGGRRERKEKK